MVKTKMDKRIILFFILFLCIFVYYYFELDKVKKYTVELFTSGMTSGMTNNEWSKDLKDRFLKYQDTMTRNDVEYNLKILQSQVTPEEVEDYLKRGKWNWDQDLQKMYLDKVKDSTIVKINPEQSLDYAMRTYNSKAMTEILLWNYKEGEFLLYGAKDKKTEKMYKCSEDPEPVLQANAGFQANADNADNTSLNNEEIPDVITGFSFINEPCNPCVALKHPIDKSCAFKLNVKGDDNVSDIWKKMWNL